jgi:hypothetical protein
MVFRSEQAGALSARRERELMIQKTRGVLPAESAQMFKPEGMHS